MCGIVGIVDSNGERIDEDVLWNMTNVLRHRGPDDADVRILCSEGNAPTVGLGHRRLSVIDLSTAGRQPMSNEDGTIWITYNGEVYNFSLLRKELESRGHFFRSRTDTEVIIHGYEEYGIDILNRLNGMFAFGLWDSRCQRLLLARDRFGKKPLYYWHTTRHFVFASELKAIIKHPYFERRIDLAALCRYLAFEYVPTPYSIYEGICKLPAGCWLEYCDGKAQIHRYWRINFGQTGNEATMTVNEAAGELVYLLEQAVARRLVCDVPLGVFLSGGVDSSAVVAMAVRHREPRQIATFSIGFEEPTFDESRYCRLAARHFGTVHHEQRFSSSALLDALPQVVRMLDEPFADASILPTYLLSKFARQSVTVALGGDGGDELLAGYDPFVAHRLFWGYERIPSLLRRHIIEPLARHLPVSDANMSFDFRIKQMIRGSPYPRLIRNQAWLGAFLPHEIEQILSHEALQKVGEIDPYRDIKPTIGEVACRDWIDETIAFYQSFYLTDDILTKIDRASMAVSLEVRSPFLDVELTEFVNRLPSHFKLRALTRKWLLKKAMASYLPAAIRRRSKKGFGIPLTRWLREDLRQVLLTTLAPERIRPHGLFNPREIARLIGEHCEGRADNRKKLWTLFMFHQWLEHYGPDA